MLGVPVAAGAKQRFSDDRVVISSVIGDVEGRDVIVLDDEIARGSTIMELLRRLRERGVGVIRIACTHGLFTDDASAHGWTDQPDVPRSSAPTRVPISKDKWVPKLRVLSIAPALAEAIRRIHNGESVSALFH